MQLVIIFGMLIVDMSAGKLPSEAKQNNIPPKCGQIIDRVHTAPKHNKIPHSIENTALCRWHMGDVILTELKNLC
jgi:hypothetical protein